MDEIKFVLLGDFNLNVEFPQNLLHLLDFSIYQHFEVTNKMYQFSSDNTNLVFKFLFETLTEEGQPVVTQLYEHDYREKSILFNCFFGGSWASNIDASNKFDYFWTVGSAGGWVFFIQTLMIEVDVVLELDEKIAIRGFFELVAQFGVTGLSQLHR